MTLNERSLHVAQYNSVKCKIINFQVNKLKSAIKNATEVTLKLSSNMICYFNDETNSLHKSPLNDSQISKIRRTFANNLPVE